MGIGVGFYIRNLVAKDMRQRIATAWMHGETLSIPEQSSEIARLYPGSGLPNEDLGNRIFAEATGVGLPVELARKTSRAMQPG